MAKEPLDDAPAVTRCGYRRLSSRRLDAAYLRLMGLTSLSFADRWREGWIAALESLSLFPARYEVAPESEMFGREVRRMLYRQGRVAYRVLYTLIDTNSDSIADTVHILRIVHAAQDTGGRG